MLRRIFNWFAEGQAPPPDVLDEERGVDWDAWREAGKEDAPGPMFVDMKGGSLDKDNHFNFIEDHWERLEEMVRNPSYDNMPCNSAYGSYLEQFYDDYDDND